MNVEVWAKVGWNPHGIAISPDSTYAYVTNTYMPPPPRNWHSTVMRVDLKPGTPAYMDYVVKSGDTLWAIAENQLQDANRWPDIFEASKQITQPGGGVITDPNLIKPGWTLRIPTNPHVRSVIGVGNYPTAVVFTPNAEFAYVTNFYSNSLSVIRTNDDKVVATIGLPAGNPWDVAMDPAGKFIYVTHFSSGIVSRVEIPSHKVTVLDSMGCAGWAVPWGVAIRTEPESQGGRTLAYITDYASRRVTCIDTADDTLADTFDLPGNHAMDITVSPDSKFLYVALRSSNGKVVRINTRNRSIMACRVGADPWSVSLSPDGSSLYVTVGGENSIVRINTATMKKSEPPTKVGINPMNVAAAPSGAFVLSVDTGSHQVSRLW